MPYIWQTGCGSAFLLVLPGLLFQPPLPSRNDFTFSDNVNLVLLDASVKDPHAGFVAGLRKENFQLTENGKPQVITQFGSVDSPVTLGLVVDNSGSMRTKRDEVLQAGLAFARESNARDEFFVVNFNNAVVPGLPPQMPFTDSLPVLQRALYYGTVAGQTALYDAISYSLRHLELGHREQRTLVVVSDGGDNVSKISRSDLLDQIQSSRATIYAIGLADPENRDLNPAVLRKFAAITGGEYFQPKKLDEVRPIFEHISKDLRSRYTIGFVPAELSSRGKDRHAVRTIKVSASRDGQRFNVRARTTYRLPSAADKV